MKILTNTLLCLYLALSLATAQTDCAEFDRLIRDGNTAFKQGNYKKAINKYQAAMTNCPSKMAEVQPKIAEVFYAIEQLRYQAEQAQKEAKENEQRARIAQQQATKNEAQALALLEDIAFRDLYQAEQSILNTDWQSAYDYLRNIKTKDPALLLKQKQCLVALLYKELYESPIENWTSLEKMKFFKREGNAIVPDIRDGQPLFGVALLEASQKPNKTEARHYLLAEMRRILGKEAFVMADNLFEPYKKSYPFKFNASDFEPRPADYSQAYQPKATQTEVTENTNKQKEEEKIDYNRLVMQAYEQGDYAQAYQYQRKAVEQDSTNSSSWFNLSYFALFNNAPKVAIEAAQQSLARNPKAQSACTNLALGYLLNNEWKKAERIYWYWKGQVFPDERENRTCKEIFLADIADLEKAGIKHKDFKKVRKLL